MLNSLCPDGGSRRKHSHIYTASGGKNPCTLWAFLWLHNKSSFNSTQPHCSEHADINTSGFMRTPMMFPAWGWFPKYFPARWLKINQGPHCGAVLLVYPTLLRSIDRVSVLNWWDESDVIINLRNTSLRLPSSLHGADGAAVFDSVSDSVS